MCDIDRELVMRAAAHFATYAAEQEPPKVDQFTARLIERALRAKLPTLALPAPSGTKPKRPVGDMSTAMRKARDLIMTTRGTGSAPSPKLCKVLVAGQAEPDRSFTPQELAAIGGYPNPSTNGKLHGQMDTLIELGLFVKPARGLYKLGPKGAPVS